MSEPPADRRGDWAHGVDENLASLNAGQRVWERDIGTIRKLLSDIDHLLRGDIDRHTSGLVGRIESMEHDLSKINAVLFVDASGSKGIVHDVRELKGGREDRRMGWGNITKIVVALIMAGLLGRFYGDAVKAMSKKSDDPLAKMIDRAKRPKGKPVVRYRVIKKQVPEPEVEPEPEEEPHE